MRAKHFPVFGLLACLLGSSAQAANCTWTGGPGFWNDSSHWLNCAGGSGTVPGTPGPADTASLANGDSIQLVEPTEVDTLILSAGSITGAFPLRVNTLNWSDGTIASDPGRSSNQELFIGSGSFTSKTLRLVDRHLVMAGNVTMSSGASLLVDNVAGPGQPCGNFLPFADVCVLNGATLAINSTGVAITGTSMQLEGTLDIAAAAELTLSPTLDLTTLPSSVIEMRGGNLLKNGLTLLRFDAGLVRGTGYIAADDMTFQNTTVDIGGSGVGSLEIAPNSSVSFESGSRVLFDINSESPGDFDTLLTRRYDFRGSIVIRSPLGVSSASFPNLIDHVAGFSSFNPQAIDSVFGSSHRLNDVSGDVSLVPAGGSSCLYTGPSGGQFNVPANWSGCASNFPQPGDLAVIQGAVTVRVDNTLTVGRLKLDDPNANLEINNAVLTVAEYFKWDDGTVRTVSGRLQVDSTSFGRIGKSNGGRQLDGDFHISGRMALADSFGIAGTPASRFKIEASGILTATCIGCGADTGIGVAQFGNDGILWVPQGANLQINGEYRQFLTPASPGRGIPQAQLYVGPDAFVQVELDATANGIFGVQGGLILDGSRSWLMDSSTSLQVSGTLFVRSNGTISGDVDLARVFIDSFGGTGDLALNGSSVHIGELTLMDGGTVRGSAPLQVDRLYSEGGIIAGNPGQTLTVAQRADVVGFEIIKRPQALPDGGSVTTVVQDREVIVPALGVLAMIEIAELDIQGSGRVVVQGLLACCDDQSGAQVATITGPGTLQLDGTLAFGLDGGNLELGASLVFAVLNNPTIDLGDGGHLIRTDAPLTFPSATIVGSGFLDADVENLGATIAPGGQFPPFGVIQVSGSYRQDSSGVLRLEVGGTNPGVDHDVLLVDGNADFDNATVQAVEPSGGYGYFPVPGTTYNLIHFNATTPTSSIFGDLAPNFTSTHTTGFNSPPPAATRWQMQPLGGPGPDVAVGDVLFSEADAGSQQMMFPLTVTGSGPATVDYTTMPGSADGSDFTPTSGTANVTGGVNQTILVAITPDAMPEADETFTLELSNCVGCTISDASGTGTIVNDDPLICTWQVNGPGIWDLGSNWDCGAIPGPTSTAIVGAGTPLAQVDLNGERVVANLQLDAGEIGGSASLTVVGNFQWSGGTLSGSDATSQNLILPIGSTALLNGGSKILRGRRLANDGTINWSAGDLQLQADNTEFRNNATLNISGPSNFGLSGDGAMNQTLHNTFGGGRVIGKSGSGVFTILTSIGFPNGGAVNVDAGRFVIGSAGGDNGSYTVAAGALLEFVPAPATTRTLLSGSVIAGSGRITKRGAGTLQVTTAGIWAASLETVVEDGVLEFNHAGSQSFGALSMVGGELSGVIDDFTVTSAMTWDSGRITGPASSSFTLGGSATGLFQSGAKMLATRTFSIAGNVQWTGGDLTLDGSTSLATTASGLLQVNNIGTVQLLRTDAGSPLLVNAGTLLKQNVGALVLDAPRLDGNGTLTIGGGDVRLRQHVGGGFDGATVNAPGRLVSQPAAPATFLSDTVFSGNGTLVADSGATTFAGTIGNTLALDLVNGGTATLNPAAPVTLRQLRALNGSTTINVLGSDLTVNNGLQLSDAVTVGGDAARTLRVSGGVNLIDFGATKVLSGPTVELGGTTNWSAGNISLQNAATLRVPATGVFNVNLAGGSLAVLCSSCSGNFDVAGTVNTSGPGNTFLVQAPASYRASVNSLTHVQSGNFEFQSSNDLFSGATLRVNAGASVTRSGGSSLQFSNARIEGAGLLQGSGGYALTTSDIYPGTDGSAARLRVDANLAWNGGRLVSDIGGTVPDTQYDRLELAPTRLLNLGATTRLLVKQIGGFVPAPADPFNLVEHGSGNRTGTFLLDTPNPHPTFGLRHLPSSVQYGIAGPATCTWDGSTGSWDDPARWANCSAGNGVPVGTPGPADTAIVNGGTVNLAQAESIVRLQLNGGTVAGDFNLTVSDGLDWTGGTLSASAASSKLIVAASATTSTLSGGNKALARGLEIASTVDWSGGLINVGSTGRIGITASGRLNIAPTLAIESISGTGAAALQNDGVIAKSGSQAAVLDTGLAYSGNGAIDVTTGRLEVRSPGSFGGAYSIASGAELRFSSSNRSFAPSASIGGAGTARFGDSAFARDDNAYGGLLAFVAGGRLVVENARLFLNGTGTYSVPSLDLVHPAGVLGGSANSITVTALFDWNSGELQRGAGQLLAVAPGAVLDLDGTALRTASGAGTLSNQGSATWSSGSIVLGGGFVLRNESGASISATTTAAAGLNGTGSLVNLGSFSVSGSSGFVAGPLTTFSNDGSVSVTAVGLLVDAAGDAMPDQGSYAVSSPGHLRFASGNRTLAAAASLSGSGAVFYGGASDTTVLGSHSIHTVRIESSATLRLNGSGPVSPQVLELLGGVLEGSAELRPLGSFLWQGGTLRGAGLAQRFVLPAGASGSIATATGKTLQDRTLEIGGSLNHGAGVLDLVGTTQVDVQSGGLLALAPASPGSSWNCSACSTVLNNAGQISKSGSADFELSTAITVNQTDGQLLVDTGLLRLDTLIQNSGSTRVAAGASLQASNVVNLLGGSLAGRGTIVGEVLNEAATIAPGDPGAGVLTIDGDYTQDGGGTLQAELAGTTPGLGGYDQLVVTGTATLAGVVDVSNLLAFTPPPGSTYELLTYASHTGVLTLGSNANPGFELVDGPTAQTYQEVAVDNVAVDTVLDTDLQACDPMVPADCSLRGAIKRAASAGVTPFTINFAIPGDPSTVHVIQPLTALPPVSGDVIIDGYSQPGASQNSGYVAGTDAQIRIELDGSSLTASDVGLDLSSNGIQVRGLALVDFAVAVQAPANDLSFEGNFVGVHADGLTDSACGVGLRLSGNNLDIGDFNSTEGNLLAGCDTNVEVRGNAGSIQLFSNLIGTNRSGSAALDAGNGVGLLVTATCAAANAPALQIGTGKGVGNVFGGLQTAIRFAAPFGTDGTAPCIEPAVAYLRSNQIGVYQGLPVPNQDGIVWGNASAIAPNAIVEVGSFFSSVDGNEIAWNSGSGVVVQPGVTGLSVYQNSIHDNGGLGIDLRPDATAAEINRPTPNDPDDADTGPNRLQNFARIHDLQLVDPPEGPDYYEVTYSVDSSGAHSDYGLDDGKFPGLVVDFYLNQDGQGVVPVGAAFYELSDHDTPPVPGTATAILDLPSLLQPGDEIIAVVTDRQGNSSEFSFVETITTLDPLAPEPVMIGQDRTVSGKVRTSLDEPFAPGGQVEVSDGTDSCVASSFISGVQDSEVLFSCVLPTTGTPALRTLTATYVPNDRVFRSSAATLSSTVQPASVPTSLVIVGAAPAPVALNQPYTLTVEVTASAGPGAPTGTVTLTARAPFDSEGCIATLAPTGPLLARGSCQVTSATPGVRQFDASYAGAIGFFPTSSSAALAQVVTTTASFAADGIVQTPPETQIGQPFQVAIAMVGNGIVPSGTITVTPLPFGTAANCQLAPLVAPNSAGCTLSMSTPVAVGKLLRVRYGGSVDGVVLPAETTVVHNTLRADTVTRITADTPDPSAIDQPVTVTFVVEAAAGAISALAPLNGQVRVSDGLDSCTGNLTPVTSGTSASGSCQLSLRVGGVRQLVATYQASENFASSVSAAEPHTVSGGAGGADLSIRLNNFRRVVTGGVEVEYTIEVMNGGSTGAGSSRVQNALPPQLSNASWSCVPVLPSQCPASGSGAIDQLVDLVAGGRVTFRLRGLATSTEGIIENTASVTPAAGITDPNLANNSATDRDPIGLFGDGLEDPGLE